MARREPINSREYKGYTINIFSDEDSESPRDWDNVGTMICWHSRYNLGDYKESKKYEDSDDLFASIIGYGSEDMEDLTTEQLLTKAREKAIILPLFLYDHSGITISTGSFNDRFDSGQVGWIYVTNEKVKEEWGEGEDARAKAIKYLEGEVETYDTYVRGEVVGYDIEDLGESCWGYYSEESAYEDAQDIIDYTVNKHKCAHMDKVKIWIKNKVPLYARQPNEYAKLKQL